MKNLFSNTIRCVVAGGALLTGLAASAEKHEPYNRSRIYWDQTTLAYPMNGGYGRMIQLLDGRLMALCGDGVGIIESFSSDYGKTWSTRQIVTHHPDKAGYGSPDFTQLADGTLLVGLNYRPNEPYTPDRKFGISVIRSTDLGNTWSEPIFIYDAQHEFHNGCWEPSFLQLPSGEVHCYFSNEGTFTESNEQDIVVSRSFDNGLTWGPIERVSFRAGHRDGMPSAIITDNNEIVVVVEDNGHPGYSNFRATTQRCSLEQNWHDCWVDADSPNRNMIFEQESDKKYASAAPYIRKLANGETVVSWMGEKEGVVGKGLDYYPLFVAVGDEDARNFKAVSQPFNVQNGGCANWGSLGVADDGYVYAIANLRVGSANKGLGLIKGMPRKGFTAAYGTPVLDGSPAKDAWAFPLGRQLTMGSFKMDSRVEADFLYDNENFYVYTYVIDRDIVDDKVDNDGVFLYLDLEGCCDTYPQKGMFRMFFDIDGTVEFRRGDNSKWQPAESADGITYKLNRKKNYYMVEAAIPWKLLGYDKAPVSDVARMNFSVRDRRSTGMVTEIIPDAEDKASWTWPELYFGEDASVEAVIANSASQARLNVQGKMVSVEGAEASFITLYTTDGMMAATSATNSLEVTAPGLYIVEARFADGSALRRKVAIR